MGKNRKLYLTDYCLTPHVNIPNAGILCEGNKVIGIGGITAFSQDEPGLEVIDMAGNYALPGLIDCHVHGGGGFDSECILDSEQHLEDLCLDLATKGVTAFLPTLVAMPRDKMIAVTARMADMLEKTMPGAAPCGLHLEGPFINREKRGTQAPEACSDIDFGYLDELIKAGNGRIKLMTFAPELPGAEKLIETMLNNGIIPSMGHSMADAETTFRAIDAGARRCTHLFNGLPPLHHRHTSITDVVFTQDEVAVELILDGGHIGPRMVDIAARVKPNDKMIAVSNAFQITQGGRSGKFVKDGFVYTKDGIIAGSALSLDTSWIHLRSYSHMSPTLAAACFTCNPAKDIGLITRGELTPGKRADITFFDSASDKVVMTIANGIIVFKADHIR